MITRNEIMPQLMTAQNRQDAQGIGQATPPIHPVKHAEGSSQQGNVSEELIGSEDALVQGITEVAGHAHIPHAHEREEE